ncbi:MAG: A/G-specific adenine glycosylase [Planctomycetota bacterium]
MRRIATESSALTPATRRRLARVPARLRPWYLAQRRDLPWRRTRDPYAIWISEIMLQQTQVAAVIPYYERFLARFPAPSALALASDDELIAHWAGLGYYARGRNLKRAAEEIVRTHGGQLPAASLELLRLPGIGPYTAAAIGSIAFGEAVPVIDGNVERVLARVLALEFEPRRAPGKSMLAEAARCALDHAHPGDHNQALMELGATVCTPTRPHCAVCPLATICQAHRTGCETLFPLASAKRGAETQHWIAATPRDASAWLVVKTDDDAELLAGHWGFPLERWPADTPPSAAQAIKVARRLLRSHCDIKGPTRPTVGESVRHQITYRRLHLTPVRFRIEDEARLGDVRRVAAAETSRLPAMHRKLTVSRS